MDPIQNPLFKEPVGSLFKARREQMGLSPEEVAKRLKFSTHMVEAIESTGRRAVQRDTLYRVVRRF